MNAASRRGSLRPGTRGFTLIELLIVLVIIGILAAILFPVFGRVRDGARTATCASNLKQIGLALREYVGDNNRHYPVIFKGDCTWVDSIAPYVRSNELFHCPALPGGEYDPSACPAYRQSGKYVGGPSGGSYSLVDFTDVSNYSYGASEVRLQHPSSTILVVDDIRAGHVIVDFALVPPANLPHELRQFVSDRHHGGANALFVDGHVKWMSMDAMSDIHLWRGSTHEPAQP